MTRASDVGSTYVAQQRARGVTWPALARMTGAAEIDLRRLYGGLVLEVPEERPVDALTAAGRVRRALLDAGMISVHARIIARLWRANGGRMPAASLTQGLMAITPQGGGDTDAARAWRVKAARRDAEALGIEFLGIGRGTGLTVKGMARLSEMAGLKPGLDVAA
ncbi:MAG: hypothetical protein ACREEY_02705 [Brevundimonas sp.]